MATKHLFLEGPIQTGKSTLIRKALAGHMNEVSGFTSQRLVSGIDTLAFRIAKASEPLTADIAAVAPDWPETDKEALLKLGIFKGFTPDGTVMQPEVFQTSALELLKKACLNGKLILLDEIGGHELAVPEFREALYDVLAGDIPCIGVIKHPASTRRMDPSLLELNNQLHKHILRDFNGSILYFDRQDPSAKKVEQMLEAFVTAVFD